MPLRDHFRPPVSKREFVGRVPRPLARHHRATTRARLPDGFVAEPRVHLGSFYESTSALSSKTKTLSKSSAQARRQVPASPLRPRRPAPTLTLDAEFPDQYTYEVLIFDLERDRRLVAAVEIVSPANKDRAESRQVFVAKCFHLLRQDVCLSIIDLVTIRQFNLYTELLALLERRDPAFAIPAPPIYAVTCRKRQVGRQTKLDTWAHALELGRPLPSLPVWLSATQNVTLELETSYEETCRVLRITAGR